MKTDKIAASFSSLDREGKVAVLISLASDLTVWARDTYVVGSEEVAEPERLRWCNEIQHRLLGQLYQIFTDDKKCYPDDIFFRIIFEMGGHAGILSGLNSALDKLLEGGHGHVCRGKIGENRENRVGPG